MVSLTTLNVNGGTVCMTAFYPSTISVSTWNVAFGATLKINGSVSGTFYVAGTLAAGCSPGTATIQGDVLFQPGADVPFELDQPNVVASGSDWIDINGNLTLDGKLDVIALSNFGAGTYRLFDYSGTLVNHGVQLGSIPAGFAARLDFATTNQVNLVVLPAVPLNFNLVAGSGVLNWTSALYHLQSTPRLDFPWTNFPGSSPATVPLTNPAQFFRLINP